MFSQKILDILNQNNSKALDDLNSFTTELFDFGLFDHGPTSSTNMSVNKMLFD
jgi:hypothetical protein